MKRRELASEEDARNGGSVYEYSVLPTRAVAARVGARLVGGAQFCDRGQCDGKHQKNTRAVRKDALAQQASDEEVVEAITEPEYLCFASTALRAQNTHDP
jgi:hypothetical protein